MPFIADSSLGEGKMIQLYPCVAGAVGEICIVYTSKALKWGKVLMQIFTNSRSPWFFGRAWQIVRWRGYGYGIW